MDHLKREEIIIGIRILRNDLVSSAWVPDYIHNQEKVDSLKVCYDKVGETKFYLI